MSELRVGGTLQASYHYDAMGRQAIHSVFDSMGRRIAEYSETSGALLREYVWLGWEPVAVIEGEADKKTLQWSVFPPYARARLRGPGG